MSKGHTIEEANSALAAHLHRNAAILGKAALEGNHSEGVMAGTCIMFIAIAISEGLLEELHGVIVSRMMSIPEVRDAIKKAQESEKP